MAELDNRPKMQSELLKSDHNHDHSTFKDVALHAGTAAVHAGAVSANMGSLVPLYALTGAIKVINYLTKDQHSFLDTLSRNCIFAREGNTHSSFSEVVRHTELSHFSNVFSLNTPLAKEFILDSRKKLEGISANSLG